jgi:hypothetical protein
MAGVEIRLKLMELARPSHGAANEGATPIERD